MTDEEVVRLMEAGFTGTIKDALGRMIKFVNGVRVKGTEAAKELGGNAKSAAGALGEAAKTTGKLLRHPVQSLKDAGADAKNVYGQLKSEVGGAYGKLSKFVDPRQGGTVPLAPTPTAPLPTPPKPRIAYVPFDKRAHFAKNQRDYIGKILGTGSSWTHRPVTTADVKKLDDLANRVYDPTQKKALAAIASKVENAAKLGVPAYIPVGKIKQKGPPPSPAGAVENPKPTPPPKGALGDLGPPPEPAAPTSAVAPPPSNSPTPSERPPEPAGTGLRGIENKETVPPQSGAKRTFSVLTHRSPKNRVTDRPRSKGETVYANLVHNQVEPTPDELGHLKAAVPQLTPDQKHSLARKFGVSLVPREVGKRTPRGYDNQVLADHIDKLLSAGAGKPAAPFQPIFRRDTRASKYRNAGLPHLKPK